MRRIDYCLATGSVAHATCAHAAVCQMSYVAARRVWHWQAAPLRQCHCGQQARCTVARWQISPFGCELCGPRACIAHTNGEWTPLVAPMWARVATPVARGLSSQRVPMWRMGTSGSANVAGKPVGLRAQLWAIGAPCDRQGWHVTALKPWCAKQCTRRRATDARLFDRTPHTQQQSATRLVRLARTHRHRHA